MRSSPFRWLLLPPAIILFVISLAVLIFVAALIPWYMTATTVLIFGLAGSAFMLKRRSVSLAGSETSLTGKQRSKVGLL